MNEKSLSIAVRLTPELAAAVNRKRGEAFAAGAEISKHDVVLGTLCAAFDLPYTPGARQGRPAKD